MNIRIDHIAIASQQPEKTKDFFNLLKLATEVEDVPTQKVRTTFYHCETAPSSIEILEPLSHDSPISKFLEKKSGVHHIALQVDHIEQMIAFLKKEGCQLINETPQIGSHNSRIAFIHPKSTGGILIELVEKQKE